jgi:hypothetical protein
MISWPPGRKAAAKEAITAGRTLRGRFNSGYQPSTPPSDGPGKVEPVDDPTVNVH